MKSASELERELCEECPIYGQTGCDHCFEDVLQYVIGMLEQEPKTGHWYYDEEREATGIYAICSNCEEKIYQTGDFEYCPNCGAKMYEPQERNDKE